MAGMSQNELYVTWAILGLIGYGVVHVSKQIHYVSKQVEALREQLAPKRPPIEYEY
jgi:hypothetical protein